MMKTFCVTQLCGVAVLLMTSLVNAAPYSKYGRTCRDIGCPSSEVCVMTEDPCTTYSRDQCGRYPVCRRNSDAGDTTCTTMICPTGKYCRTENGRPTCVNTVPGLEYDSAGVSTVNGQPSSTNVRHDTPSISSNANQNNNNHNQNQNPYANANAPPAPVPNPAHNFPVNSGTNLGYPSYPTNTGSNSNSGGGGYPPYPSNTGSSSSGTNLGYPPYPSVDRMPSPGQANYPQSNYPPAPNYPNYPQQNSGSGYPQQNNYPQQYPGHQNYPTTYQNRGYNNHNANGGYHRKNSSSITDPMISLLAICFVLVNKYLS